MPLKVPSLHPPFTASMTGWIGILLDKILTRSWIKSLGLGAFGTPKSQAISTKIRFHHARVPEDESLKRFIGNLDF